MEANNHDPPVGSGEILRPLSTRVAAQIRAELGRQDVSAAELSRRAGKPAGYFAARLSGRTRVTIADVELAAHLLGVSVLEFM